VDSIREEVVDLGLMLIIVAHSQRTLIQSTVGNACRSTDRAHRERTLDKIVPFYLYKGYVLLYN
jgi:hypothetical protein